MTTVFLGLGSNIEPEMHLRSGVACLRRVYGDIILSPVYLSPAFGFSGDPFYNMVVSLETNDTIAEIIRHTHAIEDDNGRDRSRPRYSSRTLDIDLLLYGDTVCDDPVCLPRPDILQHAFVLQPLADIAGDVRHPTEKILLKEVWKNFSDGDPLPCVPDFLDKDR